MSGPATKQDLETVNQELNRSMQEMEGRIEARIDARLEKTETAVLSAFHGYSERTALRFSRLEAAEVSTAGPVASLEADDRFTALELRVLELERKVK